MLKPASVIARAGDAIDVRVGGATVLHEPDSGRYVKLNSTAAELWDALREPVSIDDLAGAFAARHRIDLERARTDVGLALQRLVDRGLARVAAVEPRHAESGGHEHAAPHEAVDGNQGVVAES